MKAGYASVPMRLNLRTGEYGNHTFTKHFSVRLQAALNGWTEEYFASLLDTETLREADEAYTMRYRLNLPLKVVADRMEMSTDKVKRRLATARQFNALFWNLMG